MLCPECKTAHLTGRQELCSNRCRKRRSRRTLAARQTRARALLDQQSAALASGADPVTIAQLARDARRLLGDP